VVKAGEALLLDFGAEAGLDFVIGAGAEIECYEFCSALAHASAEVFPRYDEIPALVILASQDDVGMRMAGVVVVDGDPIELRPKILFDLKHEPSGQGLQNRVLDRILGGDYEAELMAVAIASIEETRPLGAIPLGVIEGARLSFSRNTIALQVSKVGLCATQGGWRQTYQPRLDDDEPALRRAETVLPSYDSADTGAPTDAAAVKFALSTRSCLAKPACMPEGYLDLSQECAPSKRSRSYPAQLGRELFVALHKPTRPLPNMRR